MIGAILIVIAIILYFKPRYRYLSYFLYLSFMMGGLNLWTDTVTGIKTMDMAVIYTFVISAYLVFACKWKIPKWPIKKYYIAVLIVIVICVLFSYFHYGLSPFQILQGGRSYLLLFSFPILIKANGTELRKVLKTLLFFCVVTSVLYIFQIVLKRPLMPYGHFDFDSATGLPRFYNMPVNLIFFLTLSFLLPKFFKGKTWVYQVIFFVAMVCTLGRTFIVTTIATILLALLMQGKMKRIGIAVSALFILMLPFADVISDRFTGAGGTSDFTQIANGQYRDYGSGSSGTMVYRFAWVYERYDYMRKQPLDEFLFGLGLVSDSQPWVLQHYSFSIGIINTDTGEAYQLGTPDISYGNLLTKLGMLGGIIYIAFALGLTTFLYRSRKENVLILISSAILITAFLNSFSGTTLSDPSNFALIFFIMSILYRYNSNSNKTQLIDDESSTH